MKNIGVILQVCTDVKWRNKDIGSKIVEES
jgi:hypothetical protein